MSVLDEASEDVVGALRWQLATVRTTYLDAEGLDARRRLAAARRRVLTLVCGVRDADVTVVSRLLDLAGAGPPSGVPSPTLDPALHKAIESWRGRTLEEFWAAVTAYVKVTDAGISEQVLLLTYLSALVAAPGADEATRPAPSDLERLAALALAWQGDTASDLFAGCARLTRDGREASVGFTTEIALLALAAMTLQAD